MSNLEFNNSENRSEISVGDWVITLIVAGIPLVGFIMLFVWAFGSNTPKSKANWAKAALIMMVIAIVLVILFWGAIVAIIVGSASSRY